MKSIQEKTMDLEQKIRKIAEYLGCNAGELVSEMLKVFESEQDSFRRKVEEEHCKHIAHIMKNLQIYREGMTACPMCGIDYEKIQEFEAKQRAKLKELLK